MHVFGHGFAQQFLDQDLDNSLPVNRQSEEAWAALFRHADAPLRFDTHTMQPRPVITGGGVVDS